GVKRRPSSSGGSPSCPSGDATSGDRCCSLLDNPRCRRGRSAAKTATISLARLIVPNEIGCAASHLEWVFPHPVGSRRGSWRSSHEAPACQGRAGGGPCTTRS